MGLGAALAVSAATTIGGAVVSSNAASSAAKTAADTAAANNALTQEIYNSNKATLQPYVDSGTTAQTAINGLLYPNSDSAASAKAYSDWQGSTGYQAALKTGQDSVTAALGQKGLTDSGAAQKALLTYGQNTANQNFQTYLGDLHTQQGTGLSAGSALAGVGTNYANTVSANNNTAATASENAALASASSINSALSNLTQTAALGSSYRQYGGFGG